jgi:hypothetical protein
MQQQLLLALMQVVQVLLQPAHLLVWPSFPAACCWLHPAQRVSGVLDGLHKLSGASIKHLQNRHK